MHSCRIIMRPEKKKFHLLVTISSVLRRVPPDKFPSEICIKENRSQSRWNGKRIKQTMQFLKFRFQQEIRINSTSPSVVDST